MHKRTFCLALVALTLSLLPSLHSAEPKTPTKSASRKTVRLLTIGNSFSGNATQYLPALAKAGGKELVYHQAGIGGGTMQQHWEKLEKADQDANDPAGKYPTKKTLRQELAAEPWDIVTIQQASIRSHDVETYRPWAKKLYDLVRESAPTAEVVLHQTWEYRIDDPRFAKAGAPGEPATQDAMYEGLTRAYETIAQELGVRLIRVGDAFHAVNHDSAWLYHPDKSFDIKKAEYPALPDQTHSLNRGWYWKVVKEKQTLTLDGHHASSAGCYLAGCVFYEFLYGETVVGNTYIPKDLKPEEARYLQQAAHAAIEKRAQH